MWQGTLRGTERWPQQCWSKHPPPTRGTNDADPSWGGFEAIGVQRIAEEDQTSTPWTFFNILVGGNLALGVMVFGWISITLGLGTVDALTSILVGVVVGIPLVWVLVLIGSRTATNNSTASGAHFGVRGRLVGSLVGLAISLAYTAIAIWSGGDATVMVLHRIFGTPTSDPMHAAIYVVLILAVGAVAIVGFHLLARVERVMVAVGAISLLLMVIGFAGQDPPRLRRRRLPARQPGLDLDPVRRGRRHLRPHVDDHHPRRLVALRLPHALPGPQDAPRRLARPVRLDRRPGRHRRTRLRLPSPTRSRTSGRAWPASRRCGSPSR